MLDPLTAAMRTELRRIADDETRFLPGGSPNRLALERQGLIERAGDPEAGRERIPPGEPLVVWRAGQGREAA